jgi:predicted TIM-barrel fold metal-dependent hydrolase
MDRRYLSSGVHTTPSWPVRLAIVALVIQSIAPETSLRPLAPVVLFGAPPQAQPAPLIDHHQHLFSPTATRLAPSIKPVAAADLIALLDTAGIRRAVVLSLAYQFGNPNRRPMRNEYEAVKTENDWTSQQVAQFPDRLRGLCSLNPLKPYALQEISRCAKDQHLRLGLKLHFGNSDINLNNPAHVELLQAVFREANANRMAIVIHMRSSVTRRRPYGAKEAGIFLDQVLPSAPDVPVQIAHLAGAGGYDDRVIDEALGVFVDAIAKHDTRMALVYFDVSGVVGLGQWQDKVETIAERIRQLGLERVLYGSDGAGGGNPAPREAWATFRKLPLTDSEFQTIAGNIAPYMR